MYISKKILEQYEEAQPMRATYLIVADMLRDGINRCIIDPGARMLEVDCAERLQVSRTTIRRAFDVLQGEGLLESRAGRGMQVIPVADNHGLNEYRVLLELQATKLAALRRMEEDIARMEKAIRVSRLTDGVAKFADADAAFHLAIFAASHNEILNKAGQELYNRLRRLRYHQSPDVMLALRKQVVNGHIRILEAIRSQNPSLARDKAVQHYAEVEVIYDLRVAARPDKDIW